MKNGPTLKWTAAMLVACPVSAAGAETRHVPDDYPTIQAALDATEDGDEVVLADGIWTGAGNRDLIFPNHLVTLASESGNRDACIIDCEQQERLAWFRVLDKAVIRSITIQNGRDSDGGAAAVTNQALVTFEDCVIKDCSAATGGAILANGGRLTITGCDITGNRAQLGGAIYSNGATLLKCFDTSFTANRATENGGGVYIRAAVDGSRISRCRFSNNGCNTGSGGGFFIYLAGFDEISHCLFEGNDANFIGGGLAMVLGSACLEGVVVRDNSANFGGGVAIENSTVEMVNCLVIDNGALTSADGGPPSGGGSR